MSDRLAAVRDCFSPAPGLIYLDAATYGLPPRATVEALGTAVAAWQSGTGDWVSDWDRRGDDCRAAFARLIGAAADAVALVPSVSVGVATVAAIVQPSDELVVPDDEFNSVLFPLLVAAAERGATVRLVPFEQLADSIRASTTLVAFSLVQSQSGRAAELADVVEAARRVGARTLVDATHAVPFVPIDQPIDFLVCAAYKHLLCPRGVAFLYIAPEHWSAIPPRLANWRSTSSPYARYYGGPLDVAPDAARFDVSLAWFSWAGAAVSLDLLVDWQQRGWLSEVVDLARGLARQLELPEPVGSVLSVPVGDAEAVRSALAEQGIKAAVRAGNVRLSPHVYNTSEHMSAAADALRRYVAQAVAR